MGQVPSPQLLAPASEGFTSVPDNQTSSLVGGATLAPAQSSFRGALSSPEIITVLETQVDDLIPQAVGYLYDQLFTAGALDVFTQPIAMKKSRPGILITVLCPPDQQAACETVLFTETTTLGIRYRQQARTVLRREFKMLKTPYGAVTLKLAYHPLTAQPMNAHPEYEDCATLARHHQVPWQVVYQAALAAWDQYWGIPAGNNGGA